MKTSELKTFYEVRKAQYSQNLSSVKREINTVSNLRLGVAIAFLVLAYWGLKNHDLLYGLPLVVVFFVLLVQWHSKLFRKKTLLENLVSIQTFELAALNGDYAYNSSGSEFIDIHHPYTHDLDIFGEGSVFQYINRSQTHEGKKLMADRLSRKAESIQEISAWQGAILELREKTDFRQHIHALSMQVADTPDDRQQLRAWLSEPAFVYGRKGYGLILNVFPSITVLLVILAFFIDGLSSWALMAAALQWVLLGFHMKRINQFHQYISRKKNTLAKYAAILAAIRQESHHTTLLKDVGARAGEGDEKVKQLASLVHAFDGRMNIMMNLLVNSLLLYDLQCVYRLEKWKAENGAQLITWLDTIRETEVLCSFGTFAFNHPQFAFPEITTERMLEATGLGHPLIPESERVVNDVKLGPTASIMIITGANMAGKSTFLRAMGVNVVLALTGAPVCADRFVCPFLDVRSGMRTTDSLKEHQSYFYAELDRLKSIMDELRQGQPLLILLDEILKGTNSTDKQAGSIALVRQLIKAPCLVAVATHDLALGELEQAYSGHVVNHSFEATIENDHLSFDYKLRKGVARKMNATFLMRKMGIIGDL